jgi:hypothetical protein
LASSQKVTSSRPATPWGCKSPVMETWRAPSLKK